ncbi:MAG TPA: DUF1614 domain-containing protein [bacterium]|nr:DUF1614 domain-containing protein [bacterium]
MIFLPFSLLLLLLLIILLPFLFFIIHIEIIKIALSKIGIPPTLAFLILLASLIGSMINIPVYSKEAVLIPPEREIFFLFRPFGMPEIHTKQIIAINLGGCIIPLLLCLYLIRKAPFLPTFFATIISIVVCFKLSKVVPGVGITIPAFIPPIVSVILAYILSPENKIPVAYISGVLGVLIGADILNLPALSKYPGVMSIGGAGVYDGIFLVGIFSVLLA